jgi:hypothetical protein
MPARSVEVSNFTPRTSSCCDTFWFSGASLSTCAMVQAGSRLAAALPPGQNGDPGQHASLWLRWVDS